MINTTGPSCIRTGLATALVLVFGLSTAWGGDITETGLQGHSRVEDPDDPDKSRVLIVASSRKLSLKNSRTSS